MKRKAAAVFAALAFLAAGYAEAVTPESACRAAKEKASGKYIACARKAADALAKSGDTAAFQEDVAACGSKLTQAWSKATAKAPFAPACFESSEAVVKDLMDCIQTCITAATTSGTCLCAVGNCPSGGKRVGNECWYYGAVGQSCDGRCADDGLTYSNATRSYAGSDGTFAQCTRVLDALGAPATPSTGDDGDCQDGWGCYFDTGVAGRVRCTGLVTTGATSTLDGRRACACE